MSQTLVKNYMHIIFSTKNRKKMISDEIAPKLFSYVTGICNKCNCFVDIVGGYENHIHILCRLPKDTTLVALVSEVKTYSSRWMKQQHLYEDIDFHWQAGYAAFSIGESDFHRVFNYISNQREHHGVQPFKDELTQLLMENDISYDERYLWTD